MNQMDQKETLKLVKMDRNRQNEWNYQSRDKPVVQNEANEPK